MFAVIQLNNTCDKRIIFFFAILKIIQVLKHVCTSHYLRNNYKQVKCIYAAFS